MRWKLAYPGVLLLCAPAAWCQKYEVAPTVTYIRIHGNKLGSIASSGVKDTDTRIKDGPAYGVRLTRNTKGYYGFELSYFLSRPTVTAIVRDSSTTPVTETERRGKTTIHSGSFNFLMYMMPAGELWRPFITAGLQAGTYQRPKINEWTTRGSRNYGGNYGGGIKIKPAKHVLFRLDFRHYIGGKPWNLAFPQETSASGVPEFEKRGKLKQLEGSVGIGIVF
jgi:hypothetical protein